LIHFTFPSFFFEKAKCTERKFSESGSAHPHSSERCSGEQPKRHEMLFEQLYHELAGLDLKL